MATVASYAPELLQIYELGSQKEFVFDCKDKKKAHALRWRLHCLRRDMRKENHWLLPVAEAVVISIRDTSIVAHPPDDTLSSDLKKALKDQGIEAIVNAPLELDPVVKPTPRPIANKSTLSENAIDSYLKKGT